ncbi:hypothetical protein [Arthrobacter alpinus]|nr:hypothetical protein [Arthrobacter alpinus]
MIARFFATQRTVEAPNPADGADFGPIGTTATAKFRDETHLPPSFIKI